MQSSLTSSEVLILAPWVFLVFHWHTFYHLLIVSNFRLKTS